MLLLDKTYSTIALLINCFSINWAPSATKGWMDTYWNRQTIINRAWQEFATRNKQRSCRKCKNGEWVRIPPRRQTKSKSCRIIHNDWGRKKKHPYEKRCHWVLFSKVWLLRIIQHGGPVRKLLLYIAFYLGVSNIKAWNNYFLMVGHAVWLS